MGRGRLRGRAAGGGGGARPDILFRSTWSFGTGITFGASGAVTDGGAWNQEYTCGQTDVLEVVSGASQSWTGVGNCLLVKAGNLDTDCGAVEVRGALAEGQSHYGRFYYRRLDRTMTGSWHNFQYNFLGTIQAILFNPNAQNSTYWRFDLRTFRDQPYPHQYWTCQTTLATDALNPPWVQFNYDEWYRYEWRLEYISGGTRYRFYPRIYDAGGTLRADVTNLYPVDNPGSSSVTMQAWYDAGNSFPVNNATELTYVGLGLEGRPLGVTSTNLWAVADFALASDDWLGAYAG